MPGTGTDSAPTLRQQSRLEGMARRDASATPPQVTTNAAVNTTPTVPPPNTIGNDGEALEPKEDFEALGVSTSDSRPPSETIMNTRKNAGDTTKAPTDMRHGRQPEEEGDAGKSGRATPQLSSHFTQWGTSSAPQIYAPPLATQQNAEPLPAGFQAYAPVIATPQPLPSSPFIPPLRAASPPSRTPYIPPLRDASPPSHTPYIPPPRDANPPRTPFIPPLRDESTSPTPFVPPLRHAMEGNAGRSGPTMPQSSSHFTPWLPSSAPYAYASPLPYLMPHSAPQGRGGYEQYQGPSQYAARGPIGRRREVYVSHDPFQKWSQSKAKPSRVSYNPYVPADGIDVNAGLFPTLPTPYSLPPTRNANFVTPLPTPYSLPPTRNANFVTPWPTPYSLPPTRNTEYPVRPYPTSYQPPPQSSVERPTHDLQASNTPYAQMPYSPRRGTYDSRQTNDQLYIPGAIPGGPSRTNTLPVQPSGGEFTPPELKEDRVTAHHSGHLEPSPSPRSRRSERRSHSPISPAHSARSDRSSRSSRVYSPTSPAYSPTSPVAPSLPGDVNLPPPHSVSAASSSAVSVSSAGPPASSVRSAPSPRAYTQAPSIGDPASLSSKRPYIPEDPPLTPLIDPLNTPELRPRPLPHYPGDQENQDTRPYHYARRGIGWVIPESLRSWGRRISRWSITPDRNHRISSRPVLYAQGEEPEDTSTSDEKSSFMATVIVFTTQRVPTDLYLVFLLFLPSFYFSRVERLFVEAELAMPEIELMAIQTSLQAQNFLDEQVPDGQEVFPLQWIRLKSTWEHFIDSLLREWKTLNVISALLLSAILTILQIDDAANDYLTRYTALLSFVCSLVSLLFGCVYIIRFATMRKTYKAAEWAMEAQESGTSTWWNIFILLALPSIWLTWSILLYIVCIMSYIWRTAPNVQESPPPLSDLTVLKIRIGFTILLGLASVYACFILATFRRYGSAMDVKWVARIEEWRLGPTAGAPYRYATYADGPVFSTVPREIPFMAGGMPLYSPYSAPSGGLPPQGWGPPNPYTTPIPPPGAQLGGWGADPRFAPPMQRGASGPQDQWFPGANQAGRGPEPPPQVYDRMDKFTPGPHYCPVLDPFLVRVVQARIIINPLISTMPEDGSNQPHLNWNMVFSTANAHRSDTPKHLSWSNGRDAPATFPRVSSMRLVSESYPWTIEILAKDREYGVTCGEIVEAIAHDMGKMSHQQDFNNLTPRERNDVSAAYRMNRSREASAPGGVLGEGLKGLDFLRRNTIFGGIEVNERVVADKCGDVLPCVFVLHCLRSFPMTKEDIRDNEPPVWSAPAPAAGGGKTPTTTASDDDGDYDR